MNCPTSTSTSSAAALRRGVELVITSMGGQEVPGTIVSVLRAAAGAVEECAERRGRAGRSRSPPPATPPSSRWKRPPSSSTCSLTPARWTPADGACWSCWTRCAPRSPDTSPARAGVRAVAARAWTAAERRGHRTPRAAVRGDVPAGRLRRRAAADSLRDRLGELGESVAIAAAPCRTRQLLRARAHRRRGCRRRSRFGGRATQPDRDLGAELRRRWAAGGQLDAGTGGAGRRRRRRRRRAVRRRGRLRAGAGPDAGDPATDISAHQLVRAVVDTGAAQVMVLPNGYVAAEELVAGCTAAIGWGIDVVPIPTGSMVQGLAALAVHEPGRQAVDDGYTMARAAGAARHGSVRIATESALTWAGRCQPGRRPGHRGRRGADRGRRCRPGRRSACSTCCWPPAATWSPCCSGRASPRSRRHRGRRHPAAACARQPPGHRAGHLPHRPSRRRAADRGRVAVASLSDRLDLRPGRQFRRRLLEEVFGIRTVDDLLRHYPRSYTEGAALRAAPKTTSGPKTGQHITIVDTITATEIVSDEEGPPNRMVYRITVGSGRSKVTATFFNANYIMKGPRQGHAKVMLSGEVGYYQENDAADASGISHPRITGRKNRGTRSLSKIAKASKAVSSEELASGFEAPLLPDLSGQHQTAELGHLRLRAPGARRPRSGGRSVAGRTACRASA